MWLLGGFSQGGAVFNGAEVKGFEGGFDFCAVSNCEEKHLVGVDVFAGGGGDVGGGDGEETGGEVCVVVQRTVVEEEVGKGAVDVVGGGELAGEALDAGILGGFELSVSGWGGRDGVELGEELVGGGGGDVGADEAAGEEGAAAALGVEGGEGAVGVAVGFAEIHVDAGAEGASEGVVHGFDGGEVGIGGGDAEAPGHEGGLRGIGLVDKDEVEGGRRGRWRKRLRGGAGGGAALPGREILGGEVAGLRFGEVAGEQEGGVGGAVVGVAEVQEVLASNGVEGFFGSGAGQAVGLVGAVEDEGADAEGDGVGGVGFLLDRDKALLADAVDVWGTEGGVLHGVGKKIEGGGGFVREDREAGGDGVHGGVGEELAADALAVLSLLLGGPEVGALGDHASGEGGEAGLGDGVGFGSGAGDDGGGEDGELMLLDEEDFEAVGKGEVGGDGKVDVGGGAGRRRRFAPALGLFKGGRVGGLDLDVGVGGVGRAGDVVGDFLAGGAVHNDGALLGEVFLGSGLDGGGSGLGSAGKVFGEEAGVAGVLVVLGEGVSDAAEAAEALETGDFLGFDRDAGGIDLSLGGRRRLELADLFPDSFFEVFKLDAGFGGDGAAADAGHLEGVVVAGGGLGDLAVVDEDVLEAAAFLSAEDGQSDVNVGVGLGVEGGGQPADLELRELDGVGDLDPALRGDGRRGDVDGRNRRAGGDGAEVLGEEGFKGGGVEVAGDGEGGVVGGVELLVEVADVVDAGGFDVGVRADDIAVIGVLLGKELVHEGFVSGLVGAALALAALVADDVALVGELGAVEAFHKKPHAVGLEP